MDQTDQKSVQRLEEEAVLLNVSGQEVQIEPNFPSATFWTEGNLSTLPETGGVDLASFVLIVSVAGTFAEESDKVIYGLVFPIRTFEVLYVQVRPVVTPPLCLSDLLWRNVWAR